MGVDSIVENNILLEFTLVIIFELILCYKFLDEKDIQLFTFTKYIKDEE